MSKKTTTERPDPAARAVDALRAVSRYVDDLIAVEAGAEHLRMAETVATILVSEVPFVSAHYRAGADVLEGIRTKIGGAAAKK